MSVNGEVSAGQRRHSGQVASLMDLVPGLDRRLADGDRRILAHMQMPILNAFEGPFDLEEALARSHAFALVIVGGMMLRMLGLGSHHGLQLLGPGDLLGRPGEVGTDLLSRSRLEARGLVQYAPLDDRVLALARRYPRLIEGLQMRADDQQQRLLAQLLISQLPRVEDRVLALMWLLAETWGRVTPSGTVLPVRLTHEAIGLLVGARRSTVTLALRALEERGALLRRIDDWLILEQPPPVAALEPPAALPSLIAPAPVSAWIGPLREDRPEDAHEEMARLRMRQATTMQESRTQIATAGAAVQHSRSLLERIARRRSARARLHHEDDAGHLAVPLAGAER